MESEKKRHRRSSSRSSFPAMEELEPSPVEESPSSSSAPEDSYFPVSRTSDKSSLSSRLGLSGHSKIWWLSRLHRYSTYPLTAYLCLHIPTVSLIPAITRSIPASDTYLLLVRPYYQSPLLEPTLIIIPLATHLLAGLALRLVRRRRDLRDYGELDDGSLKAKMRRWYHAWPTLSGTSTLGYALLPLIGAHAFVNRILPLSVEGGSSGVGLGYVAHGFAKHPALSWATYVALISVGSMHAVWGWARYLGLAPEKATGSDGSERERNKKRRWYGANAVALGLMSLWMVGGLGIVARAGKAVSWVGRGYDELYRKIPIVGPWM